MRSLVVLLAALSATFALSHPAVAETKQSLTVDGSSDFIQGESTRPLDRSMDQAILVIVEHLDVALVEPEFQYLGQVVSENLLAALESTGRYGLARNRANLQVTGQIFQTPAGFSVNLRFYNYFVEQAGGEFDIQFDSAESLIDDIDRLVSAVEAFQQSVADEEQALIDAEARRLRELQEAEARRLAELRRRQREAAEIVANFRQVTADMVEIAAGRFRMGNPYIGAPERPVHRVELDGYFLDRSLVTNAQYAEWLNNEGSHMGEHDGEEVAYIFVDYPISRIQREGRRYIVSDGYGIHPVTNVSWAGAHAYCDSLGKRLPTEAEWEFAAGGGGQLDRTLFPLGQEFDPGLYAYNSTDTVPIMSFPPSPLGIYDLSGLVNQWTADWYDRRYYEYSAARNPTGAPGGQYRVIRGGSWIDTETEPLMASYRGVQDPNAGSMGTGFRCAITALDEETLSLADTQGEGAE